MIKNTIFILLVCLSAACSNPKKVQDLDLPVYKTNREFLFKASHYNSEGELYFEDTLKFITSDKEVKRYKQQTQSTWIIYEYDKVKSFPGVEENDSSLWIHPPRYGRYKKLEFFPFPMVKYPLVKGNNWVWDLNVGNHWSIPGFIEWEKGNELFSSHYAVENEANYSTSMGDLDCYEIVSKTSSKFKQTSLTALFNKYYGFVKLDYKTIDNERLTFELIEEKNLNTYYSYNPLY
ncbi:hypothetical protein [Chondrinema litorale]|uniref:hypothetical protein n=1 Tax=Chondrinema litorale TaxID=2994555 RepID=UPI002542A789|nr:hypothetical protein [Chondrinema litorale]UZR97441.1 hypothetical protein OQ292_26905 [Chondrinema litorale]